MKKTIDIAIPTLNRPEKLGVLLDSIEAGYAPGITVYVLVSSHEEVVRYSQRYGLKTWIKLQLTDYSKVSTCWNEFVARSTADYVLFLCDDCSLEPDCLVSAVTYMQKEFPDGDGLLGFNVTNYPPSWPEAITQMGFRFVGRRFHERFPQSMAYCPEYYRFYVDTEMGLYAKELGRFRFAEDCRMQHFHPNAPGGSLDETHYANRGDKQIWDNEIWKARQAAGYLWGRDTGIVGIR